MPTPNIFYDPAKMLDTTVSFSFYPSGGSSSVLVTDFDLGEARQHNDDLVATCYSSTRLPTLLLHSNSNRNIRL